MASRSGIIIIEVDMGVWYLSLELSLVLAYQNCLLYVVLILNMVESCPVSSTLVCTVPPISFP